MRCETTLSTKDAQITTDQILWLRQRRAQGLRRAAWKILLAVAIICCIILILASVSSAIFANLADAAAMLTSVAFAFAMLGTSVAACFFFKAQQMVSKRL